MTKSIETLYRSCPTCEACCGLIVEVDRASNRVLSIKGNPEDPRSGGYVCAKSQVFKDVYEDPDRLRKPVKKTTEGWQQIEWEEAFQLAGEKLGSILSTHGKDAILTFMGNPNGHNAGALLYTQLYMTMLNSERFFSAGTVDQQPQNVACQLLFGDQWFFPIPDIDRTDFFLCLGGNPVVSQGSLMSAPNIEGRLKAIQQRGGKVVVIDPRRSETAELADTHLFIKPGSDAFLLFAFVHTLFEENRVDLKQLVDITDGVEQVRKLAEPFTPESIADITGVTSQALRQLVNDFCSAESATCYNRTGLCTQQFGTISSWLVYVINILTGNLDREGGMMFPRPATGQTENTGEVPELPYNRWQSRGRGFPEFGGQLPASLMAEELEYEGEDRVRAVITISGNPVLSVPNGRRIREALDRAEFMVSIDIYINETTSKADLILPPPCQMEHSNFDFLFQGTSIRNFATYSPRIMEPKTSTPEQWLIMIEILARMNGMTANDLDEMMLNGMLEMIATQESKPSADTMRKQISNHRGPERLLDILLRVGPYGDNFSNEEGLTLAKLKNNQGAMDLGPLQPRLPGILRTEGQRLNLIHDLITDDIVRLHQSLLQEPNDKLLMIGRRHIRDMNSWLHNLPHYSRGQNRCTLMIHPQDAKKHELSEGQQATISSDISSQLVEITISDEIMPGVVSLPHGFGHIYNDTQLAVARKHQPGVSCNDLINDALDIPSGTAVVNGVHVTLSRFLHQ